MFTHLGNQGTHFGYNILLLLIKRFDGIHFSSLTFIGSYFCHKGSAMSRPKWSKRLGLL